MADLIEQDDMSTVPPLQRAEWHVYQLRSEAELLYVGYSRRVKDRVAAHRREKPWWPEVTEVLSERFASEDDARQREKQLWAEERPKYNKVSPFRTDEEYRARYSTRTRDRSPESRARRLERERERDARRRRTGEKARGQRIINMTAEQREAKRERKRRFVARGGSRSWRQTGPGLFS